MPTFIALAPDPDQHKDISYFICISEDQARAILEYRGQTTMKDVTLKNVPTFALDSKLIEFARTGILIKAHLFMRCKDTPDGLHTCTKSGVVFDKDIVLSVSPSNRRYVSKTFPSRTYTLKQILPVVEEIPTQIKICLVQLSGPNISPALLARTGPAPLPEPCPDQEINPILPSSSSGQYYSDHPETIQPPTDGQAPSIQSGITISEVGRNQVTSRPTTKRPMSMESPSPLALSTGGNPEDIVDISMKATKASQGPSRPSKKGKSATGVGKSGSTRKPEPSYPDMSKDLRLTVDPSGTTVTFSLDPAIANNKHGKLVIRLDTLKSSRCGAGSGFLMDPTPPDSTENTYQNRPPAIKRKPSIAPWPRKRSLASSTNNNKAGTIRNSHQSSPNNTQDLSEGRNKTFNPLPESIPLPTVGNKSHDKVREWMSTIPSSDSPDSTINNNQDPSVDTKSFIRSDERLDTIPDPNIHLPILPAPVPAGSRQPRPLDNIASSARSPPSRKSSALNSSDLVLLNAIRMLNRQGTAVIFPGPTSNNSTPSSSSTSVQRPKGEGERASHE